MPLFVVPGGMLFPTRHAPGAPYHSVDNLREAVTTLEDLGTTARRVLGSQHPLTMNTETSLRCVRAALRARETPQEV